MRKVILQLQLDPSDASMDVVRHKLGLAKEQVDLDFGVRVARREQNLYAIRVDADVAASARAEHHVGPPAAGGVRVSLVH